MTKYNGPPIKLGNRSAPYSKDYPAGTGVTNLLDNHPFAKGATSGFYAIATGLTASFVYKDCTGQSVNVPVPSSATINGVVDLDGIAATELTSTTACTVIAYWHGTGAV